MSKAAKIKTLCAAQDFCLGTWIILHAFVALQVAGLIPKLPLWLPRVDHAGAQALRNALTDPGFPVFLLVLGGAFLYVPFVHWLDEKFDCAGMRSMLSPWRSKGRIRISQTAQEERNNIRIQTITLKFGFSATIFVLCVDLYAESSPSSANSYIIVTMAFLFLITSFVNLTQLVLYDALFNPNFGNVPEGYRTDIRQSIQQKIRHLRLGSWQLLVAATILGSLLISSWLALLVNLIYGFLLYHYYFLPREVAFKIIDGTVREVAREEQAPALA